MHSSSPPRFAVLLCTHNGEQFLAQQLQSLADQSLRPAAIFIHDWASSDGTRDLIARFAQEQTSLIRIIVHHHDHAPGAFRSFVAGIRSCLASPVAFDYLALCDQDDIWISEKLARYALVIEKMQPAPVLLYSDVRLVDAAGHHIAESFYGQGTDFRVPEDLRDSALLLVNPVVGMTICVARHCLVDCEPALDGPWLMHDWALVLLAISRGHSMTFISEALVMYRQHAQNTLGAARGMRLLQRLGKASKHFARLRYQAEWLGESAALSFGPAAAGIARPGPAQRLHAVRASLQSTILRQHSRWWLACGVLFFW